MVLRPVLIYVAAGKELAASSPGTTVTEDISALESTDQSLGRGEQKVLTAQASSHRPPESVKATLQERKTG